MSKMYDRSVEIHAQKVTTNTHYGWMGLLRPEIVSCDGCLDEAKKEMEAKRD